MLQVVVAAGPLEVFDFQIHAMLLRRGLNHTDAFGKDFVTDTVAGNRGDPECLAHAGHTLEGSETSEVHAISVSERHNHSIH
ncbi:hypothetical protein D9M68_900520 [compost metagenome]